MSLFDRKTRLDNAHMFNSWGFDLGPISIGSSGVDVSNPFKPENWHIGTGSLEDLGNKIEGHADKLWRESTNASLYIGTLGQKNDASGFRNDVSSFSGTLTGGVVGTSPLEKAEADARTAELNAFYSGYGQFRNEIENSRKRNLSISESVRGETQAKLAASGILKGSKEWNRRLAAVGDLEKQGADALDDMWSDYTKSTEYTRLMENYNLDWSGAYNFSGLTETEVSALKPTFDEFYLLTRGTDEEKASMTEVFNMRKENMIKQRNS